jgi:hypothetical protein
MENDEPEYEDVEKTRSLRELHNTDDPHSLFAYSTSRGHFSDGRSDREMGLESMAVLNTAPLFSNTAPRHR